jgi:hypothetical protein
MRPELADHRGLALLAHIRTCATSIGDMRLPLLSAPEGSSLSQQGAHPRPANAKKVLRPPWRTGRLNRDGTHCTPCPVVPAQDSLWASGLPLLEPSQRRRRQHRRREQHPLELTAGLSLQTDPPLSRITLPSPRAATESESGSNAAGAGAAHAPLPR